MNTENARAHGIETSESLDEVRARHRAEKEEAIALLYIERAMGTNGSGGLNGNR